MGALNLVPDQKPIDDPKHKTGGGGGDGRSFADFAHRIYQDDRADADSKRLLLAFAYVITMQPTDSAKEQWRSVRTALGRSERHRYTSLLNELIEHDRPRYVPPEERYGGYDPSTRRCVGPRLRPYKERPYKAGQMALPGRVAQQKREEEDFRNTDSVCGAPGKHRALELLPGTGWHKYYWFCQRHQPHAMRVREQVKAQNAAAPEPIPNAGGLLACYFEADWVGIYRHYAWDGWEPPVYGVRADDWPIPGKQPVPQRARLRLVASTDALEDA